MGYLTQFELKKDNLNLHTLKPKFLLRYAPGNMRKETDGSRLIPLNAFSMDRLENSNNFETGLTGTIGFDYKIEQDYKNFDFQLHKLLTKKRIKCLL